MKAELMRQVLVQKERGLFRCCDLGEWWTPISNTVPPSRLSCGSYRDRERKAFFFFSFYPMYLMLLAFGRLRPCPFIFQAFGMLSVRNFPPTTPCLLWLCWLEHRPVTERMQFDSRSGHIPRLQVQSLVQAQACATPSLMCDSWPGH